MHSNTHLRTKISLHMSFTPTSKNFDQNRNHKMKNQTNPTHITQQHTYIHTCNFIKNETLTKPQTKKIEIQMHSNTHLRTKISLHMSFTPTNKNFDQNRNRKMKNQTNPTRYTAT